MTQETQTQRQPVGPETCLSIRMKRELADGVEHLLSQRYGGPTRIVETTRFVSPHVLARCRIEGPPGAADSVIIKQITAKEFTSSAGAVSDRLLNEWASLEFLGAPDSAVAPSLIVGSRDQAFVVIEDLGAFATVIDVVQGADSADAADAVAAIGTALGRMQASTLGRGPEFARVQNRRGAKSPTSDTTRRVLEAADVINESFTTLRVRLGARFWDELEAVEESIHGTGPIRAFVHADAGPQNCLWTGQEVKLIDFEFATFGHGLLDVVSARLGFPHSEDASRLPPAVIRSLEARYRSEIAAAVPQAQDDGIFWESVVDACAHWALGRWVGLWPRLFSPIARSGGRGDKTLVRRQAVTLFEAFIDVAAETNMRRGVATALEAAVGVLRSQIGDLETMPLYPAFASG